MTEDNPYQPRSRIYPNPYVRSLEAADFQDRLRKTSAVPDAEFWGVVAIGVVALLLANVLFNRLALVLLFAWLGGTIRVCMIYSARARAALPPLNANWLLVTSAAVCFTLQTVVVLIGFVVANSLDGVRCAGWSQCLPVLSCCMCCCLVGRFVGRSMHEPSKTCYHRALTCKIQRASASRLHYLGLTQSLCPECYKLVQPRSLREKVAFTFVKNVQNMATEKTSFAAMLLATI